MVYRGCYMRVRRYAFYFRVAKQYFTNEGSEWVKYCFCHEKIKFISSSHCVMFFSLYTQKDIDKIIEGNYRNYVIDKLTCEIMENNAPINVNPVGGGGSAGKGWGFDKFWNFLIKFPRVGNERSIKSVKKAPTPGEKIYTNNTIILYKTN